MLIFKFPSGPLSTNAILFGDGGVGAVIDPAQGSTGKILAQADKSGLSIEKILLTHSHWDHIVDLQALQKETGAFVYVHKLDAENVEAPGSDGIPLYFPIAPVQPDHFLEEGQIVKVGALELKVIHTPGHSPGGVCFYLASEKILFAGDTLFKGTYGRLDTPTGDVEGMRQSLQKLAKLPPDTRVISGHGPDTEIGKEPWLSKGNLV
jgi:glyoxylase-like metal-dependent hydrolase (beta-lactamase superfamily II)